MDIDTAVRRIRQDFPCLTIAGIAPLGEGLGNVAFEVNETYIFRFPKTLVNIVDLRRELLILPVVRTHSTLPVPDPHFVPPDHGYVGYRKLPGRVLMNAPNHISETGCAGIGRQLGAFLSSIHGIPLAAFDSSAVKRESLCLEDCLASAHDDYGRARKGIPTRYVSLVERFLDASPPATAWKGDPVFSHNDLGSEHILGTERRRVGHHRLGRHSVHRSGLRLRPPVPRSRTGGPGRLARGLLTGAARRERPDTAACPFLRTMAAAREHRIWAGATALCVP